jgi:uroporphyrinogen decarboxylase
MMTKRALIENVINNNRVDRIPVGFWFHYLDEDEFCSGYKNDALIEKNYLGHKKFIRGFQPDMVKIMSDGFFGYPDDAFPEIHAPEDFTKIAVLPEGHAWIHKQVELTKRIRDLQGDTAYFYNIFSPVSTLKNILTVPKFLEFFRADPEAVSVGIRNIAKGLSALAKSVVSDGGADGIYFSAQNVDSEKIPVEQYKRLVSPWDKSVLSSAEGVGGRNILHICGYTGGKNDLHEWEGYDAAIYNWATAVDGVSPAKGKAMFHGKPVLGGFANTKDALLNTGSKEEIKSFTQQLIHETGTQGFILGADCTVPSDINIERLEWVREAASEIGR